MLKGAEPIPYLTMRLGSGFWIRWFLALTVSLFIVVLATLPPYVEPAWRVLLMTSFSNICHQIPDRSPHVDMIALGVCHRCYGVYLGLPLAVLAFALLHKLSPSGDKLKYWLFASLGLLAVDWGAPLLGLWHNTSVTRTATGLFFGIVAGWYLSRALLRLDQSGSTSI